MAGEIDDDGHLSTVDAYVAVVKNIRHLTRDQWERCYYGDALRMIRDAMPKYSDSR